MTSARIFFVGGLISFRAKQGKSIDVDRLRASLEATRLSGRTGMEVRYLEITARGQLVESGSELRLELPGGQQFALVETAGAAPRAGERLREALARGEKVVSVTGRVEGWRGLFPDMLRALYIPAGMALQLGVAWVLLGNAANYLHRLRQATLYKNKERLWTITSIK